MAQDNDTQSSNDNPQEPEQPEGDGGTEGSDGGQGLLTQDEVDSIVERRLSRERSKYEQQLEEERKKREQLKKQKERERREEKEEYRELYEETQQELESVKSEYEQRLTSYERQVKEEKARGRLLKAAQQADAVAPDHIVAILNDRVKVDEDGQIKVTDDSGELATDGKGTPLTPENLVQQFVDENPHFQRAAPGRGSGGRSGGEKPPESGDIDLDRAKTDPDYFQQHKEEIRRKVKDGEISV
ncbi:MAG: hypothetical protein U5L04_02590 [Trueperaceae bacterium]|nr:hypothetical protein [Trueperaceae bacterium]